MRTFLGVGDGGDFWRDVDAGFDGFFVAVGGGVGGRVEVVEIGVVAERVGFAAGFLRMKNVVEVCFHLELQGL